MPQNREFQERLATKVVIVGSIVCGVCATVAIGAVGFGSDGSAEQVGQTAKDVLAILLPVVGTWVGTVLAFFFGKENFEAGARETRRSLGQRLSDPVLSHAIPLTAVVSRTFASASEADSCLLSELADTMSGSGFFRIPVFLADHRPYLVIHRQLIDSFVASRARNAKAGSAADVGALSVGDLLTEADAQRAARSFAIVSRSATMADAKLAMETRERCQDVFITEHGLANETVIAWLTNNEVQRAALA